MKIQDIINLAKATELNTFSLKDDVDTVVSFINLGMVELYKVFALETNEYIIDLVTGVTIYDLPSDFMYMTAAYEEVPKNADEFVVPVPINEENNPFSINTINSKQVQIPLTITGSYVSVIYVPRPTSLTATDVTNNVEVNLPDSLVTALLAYIGDRANSAIPNPNQPDSFNYYARFERACDKARALGVAITPDDLSMDTRIHTRGFV